MTLLSVFHSILFSSYAHDFIFHLNEIRLLLNIIVVLGVYLYYIIWIVCSMFIDCDLVSISTLALFIPHIRFFFFFSLLIGLDLLELKIEVKCEYFQAIFSFNFIDFYQPKKKTHTHTNKYNGRRCLENVEKQHWHERFKFAEHAVAIIQLNGINLDINGKKDNMF